jgi:bacterioferritin (cytochrome b1)
MHGDPQVLDFLNEQLSAELTAINQYFLHAKMQENLGWVKLAKYTKSESIDEMHHAELLTDRLSSSAPKIRPVAVQINSWLTGSSTTETSTKRRQGTLGRRSDLADS